MIRRARPSDLPHLQALEREAGAAFADLGMDVIAQDEPPSLDVLARYQRDGRAWVATDEAGAPDVAVAYLLVELVDDAAHVEQVCVHPAYAGRRLGSALLDAAATWAKEHRATHLTLTTFAEVPWNAPYYARLGFHVLGEDQMGEGLRRIREHEAAHGLDRWPRVTMCRPVELTCPPGC